MRIFLRNGVTTDKPEEVILRYYEEMGSGVRAYDGGSLPSDNRFPRGQLLQARELANRLGGRGIPEKAIDNLCARQSRIEKHLQELPSTVTILDDSDHIPWHAITGVFEAFRVPYVTTARYTKMLHKKRPSLIPILDSRVRDYFLSAIARRTPTGLSEAEEATHLIREARRDISQNREALLALHQWRGKPFCISVVRIFDILVWCRFGPPSFRPRFANLYR